jgi:hypothetical protein
MEPATTKTHTVQKAPTLEGRASVSYNPDMMNPIIPCRVTPIIRVYLGPIQSATKATVEETKTVSDLPRKTKRRSICTSCNGPGNIKQVDDRVPTEVDGEGGIRDDIGQDGRRVDTERVSGEIVNEPTIGIPSQ